MYTMGFRVKIVNKREKHGKEKTFSSCKKATNRMFLVVLAKKDTLLIVQTSQFFSHFPHPLATLHLAVVSVVLYIFSH